MAKASAAPVTTALPSAPIPAVRLEVRSGGRATAYEVGDGGFLIGSVPGCDLRLPGSNLPPVVCLISPYPGGVQLRKLAPVQPILVNGQSASSARLAPADVIKIGTFEITLSFEPSGLDVPPVQPRSAPALPDTKVIDDRLKAIEERERQLREQAEQLEADQATWTQRREEIEADCARLIRSVSSVSATLKLKEQELEAGRAELEARENEWMQRGQEIERQLRELERTGGPTGKQHEQLEAARGELEQIRKQLAERYQARRDRLAKKELAVRGVARKLRERKEQVEREEGRLNKMRQEWSLREAEIDARSEQVARERQMVEEQALLLGERHKQAQRELTDRADELKRRESRLAEERLALGQSQKQHQSDLVRLDRLQANVEQRQQQLRLRAIEVDRGYEQLQRDTRELEEQAQQLDESHQRLEEDRERLTLQKREQDARRLEMEQCGAALEGQQTMLATLRTRLEKMRDDLRRQEQALTTQRSTQEATESDLQQRLAEANKLQSDLANDKQFWEDERRRMEERQVTLDAAVIQLRQAQESFDARAADLAERQQQIETTAAEQAEQSGLLLARGTQLQELQARFEADRTALKERELNLTRSEQALGALQESLRRRGDELATRQRELDEREKKLKTETELIQARLQTGSRDNQVLASQLEAERLKLNERESALTQRQDDFRAERERLAQDLMVLTRQSQSLTAERLAWEVEQQSAAEAAEKAKAEIAASRTEVVEIVKQLPELESRAASAIERLSRAREQMREQLAEIHTYARQSREDLEATRLQIQGELGRVQREERELTAARAEHRLAVAAFRQQLIEWQGQIGEMKQTLVRGETQLDRRQAEVEEQAEKLANEAGRLAREAEQLQEQQRLVAEQRDTMDRHLNDMREWYRKKMREISGIDRDPALQNADAVFVALPVMTGRAQPNQAPPADQRDILSVTGEIEAGDRQLGDLLLTLALIDRETLNALLLEARRQRKTLRQLLLAGNFLTLYQMALIEAGNLDGLVLGPVRVVDRLQATPHEAVYRVFDPRRNSEAILRHLAEGEMADAVRPDEFRQRFAAAAAVQHPNLAATWEVLDIADRPAALQECVKGLSGNDWSNLVAAPGVCYRLLHQATEALKTAHDAGIIHGHLQASSFVMTPDAVLKLIGLGEPSWLAVPPSTTSIEPTIDDDLQALGIVAANWAAGRKGAKMPESFQAVLMRLQATGAERYANATVLLEELDRIREDVPTNPAAWERFVKQVHDYAVDSALKRTA